MKKGNKPGYSSLRQKAEEQQIKGKSGAYPKFSEAEALKLIHELEVRQLELEKQNEELRLAQAEAERAENKYTELYDFAPSGYFTLSREGEIMELNFVGSQMLGKERARLKNRHFGFFVSADTKPAFNTFLEGILKSKNGGTCEVSLAADGNHTKYIHLSGVATADGEQCLVAATDITERRLAEEELRKREQQLMSIDDSVGDIIFYLAIEDNGKYRFVSVNQAFCNVTGLIKEQVVGKLVNEIIPEPSLTMVLGKYKQAIEEKSVVRWEEVSEYPTGRLTGEVSVAPVVDNKGHCTNLVGSVHDITKRKRMEEVLRKKEAQLSAFMNFVPDLILIKDSEFRPIFANEKYRSLFPINEWLGKKPGEVFPPEIAESMIEKDTEAMEKGYTCFEESWPDQQGIEHFFLTQKFKIIIPGAQPLLGAVISDITNRKQTEEALKESQSLYFSFIEQLPNPVFRKDREGRYVLVNSEFCKLKGMRKEDIIGRRPREIICTDKGEQGQATKYANLGEGIHKMILQTGKSFESEEEYPLQGGGTRYMRVVRMPVVDSHGDVIGMQGIMFDITSSKQAEIKLLESEKFLKETQDITKLGTYALDVVANTWKSSEILDDIFGIDGSFNKTTEGWISIIHPDWQKIMADYLIDEVVGNKTRFDKEYKIIREKDKSERWVHGLGELKLGENNQVVAMVGTIRDITEKKKAEEALLFEQYLLHSLMDNSLDVIYFKDIDSRFIRINKSFAQRCGFDSPEEVLGKSDFDLFSGSHSADAYNDEQEIIKSGIPVINKEEYETWLDGRKTWTLTTKLPLYDNEGKIVGTFGISRDITERKLAEEALNESEKKFRTVVEEAVEVIYTTDNKGYFTYANPIGIKTLGYSLDELKKIKYIDLIEPRHRQRVKLNLFKQYLSRIPLTESEYPFKTKSGGIKWFNQNARLIIENNEVTGFYVIARDITERRLVQEALKESEERYRSFISQVSEGVYRFEGGQPMDIDLPIEEQVDFIYDHMLIAECNDALIKMYGISDPKEMIGKSHLDFHGGRHNQVNRDSLRNFIRNGYHIENELTEEITISGQHVYFSNNLVGIIENHHLVRMWGTQVDITEKIKSDQVQQVLYAISNATLSSKNLDELIGAIRAQLTKLLDTTNFYIAFYDENTGMLSTSFEKDEKDQIESWPAAKSATGYVIRQRQSLLLSEEDVKKLLVSGEIDMVGTPSKIWLGTPLWLDNKVIGAIVVQSYDNPDAYNEKDRLMLEFIASQISISIERKIAEQEINEALVKAQESDRLKSAFLANMSHEIRTPMNGILGFTEMLKNPGFGVEEKENFIGIIEKSGARMLSTINDIIDFSKIESGQMDISVSEVNINQIVDEVYTFFKPEIEQKGVTVLVKNTLPSNGATVKTDPQKIYAALSNLVKNSIKFTRAGFIEIGCGIVGPQLEFYVKDTGTGIPREQLEVIFERFRQGTESLTRNYEGSGLGLSISKAYIEMLGGKMWVESELGKGSVFYFNIPYLVVSKGKNESGNPVMPMKEEKQIKKLKILIAEDDKGSEILLNISLKSISQEILIVRTGLEAVESCRNNPDIDLVLMDIHMPEMDGYEATRQIRKFNKNIVIIAQTAYALAGDKEKALEEGCDDYIPKPIKKANLLELIEKYFKK